MSTQFPSSLVQILIHLSISVYSGVGGGGWGWYGLYHGWRKGKYECICGCRTDVLFQLWCLHWCHKRCFTHILCNDFIYEVFIILLRQASLLSKKTSNLAPVLIKMTIKSFVKVPWTGSCHRFSFRILTHYWVKCNFGWEKLVGVAYDFLCDFIGCIKTAVAFRIWNWQQTDISSRLIYAI